MIQNLKMKSRTDPTRSLSLMTPSPSPIPSHPPLNHCTLPKFFFAYLQRAIAIENLYTTHHYFQRQILS